MVRKRVWKTMSFLGLVPRHMTACDEARASSALCTVDCEDLALLRQKAEVVTCELLSHDSVRTSLLSCDKAHVLQLPLFASVIRGGTT